MTAEQPEPVNVWTLRILWACSDCSERFTNAYAAYAHELADPEWHVATTYKPEVLNSAD